MRRTAPRTHYRGFAWSGRIKNL